jgi:hypothetical protein
MKKKLFLALFLLNSYAMAIEPLIPDEQNVSIATTSDFKNLQWNRYTIDNFTILSISDKQGRWLYNNIGQIKNWGLSRWGINNYNLKQECRVMVVPNKELFKKFFNLEENHVEFREKDGKLDIVAVWLCLEENNKEQILDDIPRIISSICIRDMMNAKECVNKKFIEVGVSLLNQSAKKIKDTINNTDSFDLDFLKLTDEEYNKLSQDLKEDYQKKSLIFCLMLKKEFGEFNFLKLMFLNEDNIKNIEKIYSFNLKDLKSSSDRFFKDIKDVIKNEKIDNRYLEVERSE